jgi:mannose-6-phosphate isomerase
MNAKIRLLKNPIQPYAWGSTTAIPKLLGEDNPSNLPQAEMWMGAHPKAPSQVIMEQGSVSLLDFISRSPAEVLGPAVAAQFCSRLPFLFKVLAAAKPLSIQAHPDQEQARIGFNRENSAGIPLQAYNRNYTDPSHKPELICALTPFWAMKGFRSIPEILEMFQKLDPALFHAELEALGQRPDKGGLKQFFSGLLFLPKERQQAVVARAMAEAVAVDASEKKKNPMFSWMLRLNQQYPGDIGVLSPLFLNLIKLEPGQAMFLPAGELHAYLDGVGIEIMANSDNVLRGGLTPKYLDVPELLNTLTFSTGPVHVLSPQAPEGGEMVFTLPVEEFKLSIIETTETGPFQSTGSRNVEILLCVRGQAALIEAQSGEQTALRPGVSVLVPAAVAGYRIEGTAQIFKATVP